MQDNQVKTPLLQAKKLTKVFYDPTPLKIFSDISLEVYPHQSVAIVGKSGEGKTTLLHILGTIDEPTSGTLIISGKTVTPHLRDVIRNQHIGFVFQAFHLISDITVLENVLLPLKIARENVDSMSKNYERAITLLERVGLKDRIHHPSAKLSGGEKQRTALARAFVTNPDIILADEPTGNLDHNTAHEIQELLFEFIKTEGKALILVTHNVQLAKLTSACYELESGQLRPI